MSNGIRRQPATLSVIVPSPPRAWHLLNSEWSLTTPYTKIYVRCSFLPPTFAGSVQTTKQYTFKKRCVSTSLATLPLALAKPRLTPTLTLLQ